MKSATPGSHGLRSSFRRAGGLMCLFSGLSLSASEPASISAASSGVPSSGGVPSTATFSSAANSSSASGGPGGDKSGSDAKPSTPETTASGGLGWSSRDFLDQSGWWGSSSDLSRPNPVSPIAPTIDYGTQKRLWEQIDRRQHWMFGDSDPGSAFGTSGATFESASFDPMSSLPRSVLQKKAMDDILHPGTKRERREDSRGIVSEDSDDGARRGSLDGASGRSDRGERTRTDGWSLRTASDSGSFLDWDNRSGSAASDFTGSLGSGNATQNAREIRDRASRFDEMFQSSGAAAIAGSPDSETRGGVGSNGIDSRRERLERLFERTDAVAASSPRSATVGPDGALGRVQRNELFGDGTGNTATPARRSKFADEAVRRPAFQPQPGELPLPKPNGL